MKRLDNQSYYAFLDELDPGEMLNGLMNYFGLDEGPALDIIRTWRQDNEFGTRSLDAYRRARGEDNREPNAGPLFGSPPNDTEVS